MIPLSSNEYTDFPKFLARKPSGETVLVVVGAAGRAYRAEIAAHFAYYGRAQGKQRIDPGRIEIYRSTTQTARREFADVLRQEGLDPDIVVMGNVDQFKRLLGETTQKITPIREVRTPELYGVVYEINGRQVLSLRVEPFLYADRAGAFVRALSDVSDRQRTIVFTGTAGAMDGGTNLKVGDLVVPGTFADANGLTSRDVTGVDNLAVQFFQNAGWTGKPGVTAGPAVRHGAVDSILYESQAWFDAHGGTAPRRLTVVEQEMADVARAVAENSKRNRLFAFFRVSDIVNDPAQGFTGNEGNRPEPRAPIVQGDAAVRIVLDETKGPALPPKTASATSPTIKNNNAGTLTVGLSGDAGRYEFKIDGFPSAQALGGDVRAAALARSLEAAIQTSGLATESDLGRRAVIADTLARDFQRRFGFVVTASLKR